VEARHRDHAATATSPTLPRRSRSHGLTSWCAPYAPCGRRAQISAARLSHCAQFIRLPLGYLNVIPRRARAPEPIEKEIRMAPIIEAHGLTKRFGDVRALDGLDLVADSGQVTALLGPNGAGKTTFVSAVATLLRPDSGEIRVAGINAMEDPKRVRETIGLAGQYASVEPAMTGLENLRMVARLFGLSRRDANVAAGEVLERLDLADAGDRLAPQHSGGPPRPPAHAPH